MLLGLGGNDALNGYGGADTVNGGAGDDLLRGGTGADRFVFDAAPGNDTILDFASGSDKVDLSAFGITANQIAGSTSGPDIIVSVDSDSNGSADFTITFAGIASLAVADFVF